MKTFLANRSGVSYGRLDIEAIRAASPILDVVREETGLDLQRRGTSDWWACCPFHDESTPSFHVRPSKGRFKCFGCGAGGDVYDFVMRLRSIGFSEALASLAHRAGINAHQSSAPASNPTRITVPLSTPSSDKLTPDACTALEREFFEATTEQDRIDLAHRTGVRVEHWRALGTGRWTGDLKRTLHAVTMRQYDDLPCGFRILPANRRKFSQSGGIEGCFFDPLAPPQAGDVLLVVEGESDTGASLQYRHRVIGRASARGGWRVVERYIARHPPRIVVVVADREPVGIEAAVDLANRLCLLHPHVCVLVPPALFNGQSIKDIRDLLLAGATRGDIDQMIARASRIRPLLRGGAA